MESTICLHYQSGFCKFGEFCQKQHVHQVCSIQNCNNKSCRERHPKPCKHFNTVKSCKFGELCAYKHELSNDNKAFNDLTNEVNTLKDIVNSMSNNISRLQAEIKEIKSSDSTQKSEFSCEKCDYKASSNTVLKRHTTTKHKHISLTPEKLRSSDTEDSPKLISPSEKRSEPKTNNMVTVTYNKPTDVQIFEESNFECDYIKVDKRCDFKSNTLNELHLHITMKHTFDQSYVYPNSTIEIQCDDCDEMFVEDNNYAQHIYHKHLFSYECDHCHKHLPGDSVMYEIHLNMCQAPCDSHPLCPCKF